MVTCSYNPRKPAQPPTLPVSHYYVRDSFSHSFTPSWIQEVQKVQVQQTWFREATIQIHEADPSDGRLSDGRNAATQTPLVLFSLWL